MTVDSSVIQYFLSASSVVKLVLLILFLASFVSWVFIFQRWFFLRWSRNKLNSFENQIWQTENLNTFYHALKEKNNRSGLENIFCAGFKEFSRLSNKQHITHDVVVEGVQRAMRVAHTQETDNLETHLPFLATVGSVSPYVGLFGTVWGIMMAFQALGRVQQATISMVAPGISEALIATAMGLFAAIPAVIAYNRYTHAIDKILNRYAAFEEEFSNYLLGFLGQKQ
ncbi:MAG: protein TolQ [Gammaproteobacteria bacterium]|jgi:biopolymer transport protein TolQ